MSQPYFIALWKTLYDMFHAEPEDEETYHSIASIGKLNFSIFPTQIIKMSLNQGTLLLQLGDVNKQFLVSRKDSIDSEHNSSLKAETPTSQVSLGFFAI
jgi:TBC1 domain family member 8/9